MTNIKARSGHRLRSAFVIAQCALTVVLLVGAGLLLRSFIKLQAQDPGLDASRLFTMRVSLPAATYREPERRVRFFEQAIASLEALPGVRSATATGFLPFTGNAPGTFVEIAGQPIAEPGRERLATVRMVAPRYFETMGIPILQGRAFTRDDNKSASPLCFIVNREFARRYLNGADPLRTSVSVKMRDKNPYSPIVGVTGDVREGSLDKEPEPTVYYPHAHLAYPGMVIAARTAGDPLTLAAGARAVIRSLDPNQPVADIRSMEQVLGRTVERQRFAAALLVAFSILATLLAAAGLYSVLSYLVAGTAKEISVRMALGARAGDVVWLVARQGLSWTAAGLAVGIIGAVILARLLQSLLFGVDPADPATLVFVTALLLAVALIAALIPASRAVRLDPVMLLRQE